MHAFRSSYRHSHRRSGDTPEIKVIAHDERQPERTLTVSARTEGRMMWIIGILITNLIALGVATYSTRIDVMVVSRDVVHNEQRMVDNAISIRDVAGRATQLEVNQGVLRSDVDDLKYKGYSTGMGE